MRQLTKAKKRGAGLCGLRESNPLAVAICFDEQAMSVPAISAVGRKEAARALRNTARRYGIPLYRDPALAQRLAELAVEGEIPVDLHAEVAKLLLGLNNRRKPKH